MSVSVLKLAPLQGWGADPTTSEDTPWYQLPSAAPLCSARCQFSKWQRWSPVLEHVPVCLRDLLDLHRPW